MTEEKGIRITIPQATIIMLILGLVGWGWNVERRMTKMEASSSLSQRVENLENALLPILVDFKVKEELTKLSPVPQPVLAKKEDIANIKKGSEKWAKEQIPDVSQMAK